MVNIDQPPRKRRRILTLALALGAGLGLAWIARPWVAWKLALHSIASDDAATREQGWATLMDALAQDDDSDFEKRLNTVNARLAASPDAALLHGVEALATRQWWGWDRQPSSLMLRGIDAQIATHESAWLLVASRTFGDCPLDLTAGDVLPPINRLLASSDQRIRDLALDAAFGWAGLERVSDLSVLLPDTDDVRSHRRLADARWWEGLPSDRFSVPTPSVGRQQLPWVVHARESMVDSEGEPAPGAIWPTPEENRRRMLDSRLVARDGTVFRSALIAEMQERAEAEAWVERWIRDLNDDRKRAGALLAALLGVNVDLLREAYDIEDMPAVRTTHRLALFALDADPGPGDPLEFAYRSSHDVDGSVNPDIALLVLCAGHRPALGWLTTASPTDGEFSWSSRQWLLGRFVPRWSEPLSLAASKYADLERRLEVIDVLRQLTRRRLEFDRESRQFHFDASGQKSP